MADVEFAASHPELIDSSVTPSPLDRALGGKSILVLDGPPQRRLRAMLDPSLRPRVVEARRTGAREPHRRQPSRPISARRGEAELMSEYFEPVSVLSLGRILGLGETDGDTLRRWFHGLAQGAINFENDPAKWVVSDATAAEIDAELEPVLERLWASPDSSTISTMLQHAEGTFADRVATILPTLKVILLGGMQEPGHAAGSTLAGLFEADQAAALAADPSGLVRDAVEEGLRWVSPIGTQTRRVVVDLELGGVALPAGASLGVLVSSANRDEEVWGPTAAAYDLFRPKRNHAAFGFGPHFCSGHHFSGCRCGSRSSGSSRGFRSSVPMSSGRLSSSGWSRAPAAPSRPVGPVTGTDLGPSDLGDGELREIDAGGLALVVARVGGRHVVFETWCTHAECPLGDGVDRGRGDSSAPVTEHSSRSSTGLRSKVPRARSDQAHPRCRDSRRSPRGGDPYPALVSLRLDVPREQALERAAEIVAEGLAQLRPRPPDEPPIDDRLRELLEAALPESPTAVLEVLEDARRGLDESIAQTRPRYFAFVASSGLEIGVIGDLLASCFDTNLAVWAAAATEIEDRQSAGWRSSSASRPPPERSRAEAPSRT